MIGSRIIEGGAAMGIPLPEGSAAAFDRYHEMLLDWNTRMDLTNVTGEDEALTRHYLDSLTLLAQKDWCPGPGARVADVGTGAGFPGIPLALARPDWALTLVDSLAKRLAFCRAVCEDLGLAVAVHHARAEDFAQAHRGQFDLVVSRAVAPLPVLLELTMPLLKPGGALVAYKGPGVTEEWAQGMAAAKILGGELVAAEPAPIPGAERSHVLVLARQKRLCPKAYPRKAGTPGRSPLGQR